MYTVYKKFLDVLEEILSYLAIFLLALAFIVIFSQVITRYFFSTGKPWMEELCRYAVIWMTMFCSAIAVRKGSHMRIDLLETSLNKYPKAQLILQLIYDVIELIFFLIFLVYGFNYMMSTKSALTPGLGISKAWVNSAVPLGMILMLLYIIERIWMNTRSLRDVSNNLVIEEGS